MLSFLQTGQLGPIEPGMPMAQLFDLLGDPPQSSVSMKGKLRLAAYQQLALQISYSKGKVGYIGIYFLYRERRPSIPHCLRVKVPFTNSTTIAEMIDYLDSNQVSWAKDERLPGGHCLRVGSSVSITFEEGRLRSVIATVL